MRPSIHIIAATITAATPISNPLSADFTLPVPASPPSTQTNTLQAPTPVQTKPPSAPPKTSFPGLNVAKPPELAQTTAAPKDGPARPVGGGQREIPYSQETYYTCKTRDATLTHCGWHMPIVWVGEGVGEAGTGRVKSAERGLLIGVAAVMVAAIM